MSQIIVARIPLVEILDDDVLRTKRFNNTSSYRVDCRDGVADWAPYLKPYMRRPFVWSYTFTAAEVATLAQSARLAAFNDAVSELYREELDDIAKRLSTEWREGAWMMRFDNASSKDSIVKAPYQTPRDVVYSIATSNRCYRNCFTQLHPEGSVPAMVGDKPPRTSKINKVIYFSAFDNTWDKLAEWRVFIYKGRVIAISQYDCYTVMPDVTDRQVTEIATALQEYCRKVLQESGITALTDTLVLDVYALISGAVDPQMVEMNNFYDSGSALFSWTDLNEYVASDDLHIRIVE